MTALPTALADLAPGATVLVHGADTPVGGAAVRSALRAGLQVVAASGPGRARALHDLGAAVTGGGDGVVRRVLALVGGPVDGVLDAAAPGAALDPAALAALVSPTGGGARRVTSLEDLATAC